MPNLFSISWRLLLVAALVLNPVVGATAMLAADTAQPATHSVAEASQEMPPCHQMARASAAEAPVTPAKPHGDCNAACQFAACCAIGALDLGTPLRALPMFRGAQALPSLEIRQASAPPPARMIRPPIA